MPVDTALLIGIGIGLGLIVYFFRAYNKFIELRTIAESALSDIDVHLKKRYNLIPNLVDTVKAYTSHESGILERVSELRSKAMQATTLNERSEYEDSLRGVFKNLFAVAENYPELKADKNYAKLQDTLKELEDTIEAGWRYYNASVRDYNILLHSVPSNFVGMIFRFNPYEFYEVENPDERDLHQVDFSKDLEDERDTRDGAQKAPETHGIQKRSKTSE